MLENDVAFNKSGICADGQNARPTPAFRLGLASVGASWRFPKRKHRALLTLPHFIFCQEGMDSPDNSPLSSLVDDSISEQCKVVSLNSR